MQYNKQRQLREQRIADAVNNGLTRQEAEDLEDEDHAIRAHQDGDNVDEPPTTATTAAANTPNTSITLRQFRENS